MSLREHKPSIARSCMRCSTLAVHWRPSPHSSTKPTFLPHLLLYCITTRPAHACFVFSDVLLLHTVGPLFSNCCSAHLHACSVEPLVPLRPTRVFSSSLDLPAVHVVRFCPTSCPTRHCLARVDWLTRSVSSTSPSSAIGIGKPLLFGAGMHQSHWCSCRS
jgi:hypothetical protein